MHIQFTTQTLFLFLAFLFFLAGSSLSALIFIIDSRENKEASPNVRLAFIKIRKLCFLISLVMLAVGLVFYKLL